MDGSYGWWLVLPRGNRRWTKAHTCIAFLNQREIRKFSFLKNRSAGISGAVADNNIIRKGII